MKVFFSAADFFFSFLRLGSFAFVVVTSSHDAKALFLTVIGSVLGESLHYYALYKMLLLLHTTPRKFVATGDKHWPRRFKQHNKGRLDANHNMV